MSEVSKWLRAIGLAHYADAFDANDIDMDLMTQVDDQMLRDIGVSSAGHRLRIRNLPGMVPAIMAASAALCTVEGGNPENCPPT